MAAPRPPLQAWQVWLLLVVAAGFAFLGAVWLWSGSALGWVQVGLGAVFAVVALTEQSRRRREGPGDR